MSARVQVSVSVLIGLVVGAVVSALSTLGVGALLGWDTAAAIYMTWVWLTIWPLDAGRTARLAGSEDPARATADIVLLTAALASLVAVGFVLGGAARSSHGTELLRVALGLASVVLTWGVVHTVFTLRYAKLYYMGTPGGVDFNERTPPTFADFAYLAFTIGMTFQVSDTDLQTGEIRRTALRHALLSYVFGVGIVATTINLIASITSK